MLIDKFLADEKIALVTGDTRGIGLGIARALAEAGTTVIIASRKESGAIKALANEGLTVEFRSTDMMDSTAPKALIEGIVRDHGMLDILVNDAGIADSRPTQEFDDASYDRLMTTNMGPLFRTYRAVLPQMQSQGGGVILNMGSISAIVSNSPQPQAVYNASKAAVHQFTKSLASDHAEDNIRVNAIAPGYINTEMTAGGLNDPEMAPIWRQMTPMERVGEVDEIATAALFFCIDASSYCTGSVLVADGGHTTR
jgi:NAD(P)-dependent dehydrogenase (short-subunit alcohol dehydrogenase family)